MCQHVTYQPSGHFPAANHFALKMILNAGLQKTCKDGYDFGWKSIVKIHWQELVCNGLDSGVVGKCQRLTEAPAVKP